MGCMCRACVEIYDMCGCVWGVCRPYIHCRVCVKMYNVCLVHENIMFRYTH